MVVVAQLQFIIANTIPNNIIFENDIIIYTTPGNGRLHTVVINNHKYTRNRLLLISCWSKQTYEDMGQAHTDQHTRY